MKIRIEIKSIFGIVLFTYDKENNTIKDTLTEAVRQKTDLRNADLSGAGLRGADLRNADLSGADLRNADLSGADLSGADLSNAGLRGAGLRNADLSNAGLRGAGLRNADLSGADLRNADLSGADLSGADLSNAGLRGAGLRNADLSNADLSGADLSGADLSNAGLRGAGLRNADLSNADLSGADLRNADLSGADNIPYIPLNCPSDGAFIGWEKVNGKLIKLQIPEYAKRCSATSMKCRCDKALVLAITSLDSKEQFDSVANTNYTPNIEYKVGKMVYPDRFDEDRWDECSNGIHFFINKQDAINY